MLKLQKDAADTASSYTVDVLDTEQVDAAYAMPADYVSVTGYGVTPNSGADDTAAINSALSSLSGTGKGLWFPSGTYDISGRVNMSNVAIRGAGEWYTTIQATTENGSGGLFATGGRNQIADLTVSGDQTSRNNDAGAAAIEGNFTSGSLIYDVWVEHAKVGLWANSGTGLEVAGLRVRDVFADGVHIHGGSNNSRVEQSHVRNTGDDELALDTEGGQVTNCVLANNTVQSPIQANGIGVYGGANNTLRNNAISDTVAFGSGITISTAFGGGFTGPTNVLDNVLTRTGSYNSNWGSSIGALWIYANLADITQPVNVTGNTISNSTYEGVLLSFAKKISNLTLDQRHDQRRRHLRHQHQQRHRRHDRHRRHGHRHHLRRPEQPRQLPHHPGPGRQRLLTRPRPAAPIRPGPPGRFGAAAVRIRRSSSTPAGRTVHGCPHPTTPSPAASSSSTERRVPGSRASPPNSSSSWRSRTSTWASTASTACSPRRGPRWTTPPWSTSSCAVPRPDSTARSRAWRPPATTSSSTRS